MGIKRGEAPTKRLSQSSSIFFFLSSFLYVVVFLISLHNLSKSSLVNAAPLKNIATKVNLVKNSISKADLNSLRHQKDVQKVCSSVVGLKSSIVTLKSSVLDLKSTIVTQARKLSILRKMKDSSPSAQQLQSTINNALGKIKPQEEISTPEKVGKTLLVAQYSILAILLFLNEDDLFSMKRKMLSFARLFLDVTPSMDQSIILSFLSNPGKYLPFGIQRYQLMFLIAWATNQKAVLIPGRLDGKTWQRLKLQNVRFFTPSGWAFAIWGPIFLFEMLLAIYQLSIQRLAFFSKQAGIFMPQFSNFFIYAIVNQVLWCFTFRPWAQQQQYLSTSMLGLTGYGLYKAHQVLRNAAKNDVLSFFDYIFVHFPTSLHLGWICCATLVNFNGWISTLNHLFSTDSKLRIAKLSILVGVGLAIFLTKETMDPILPFVFGWAFYALYDDIRDKKVVDAKTGKITIQQDWRKNDKVMTASTRKVDRFEQLAFLGSCSMIVLIFYALIPKHQYFADVISRAL